MTALTSLPFGWQQDMLAAYNEGASDTEVCRQCPPEGKTCMTRQVFNTLYKNEPEFAEIVEQGRQASRAWWLQQGRLGMSDLRFNSTNWFKQYIVRFGDPSLEHNADTNIEIEYTKELDKIYNYCLQNQTDVLSLTDGKDSGKKKSTSD